MRAYSMFAGALAAAAAFAGVAAAQSSDLVTEQIYSVGSFDKVAGVGANHFIITVGAVPSVRASGPARTLEHYEVVVEDGELKIEPKEKYRHDGSMRNLPPATYRITVPRIAAATLAGSGDMAVDRVEQGSFSATLAGSGKMSIGRMSVDQVELSLAGSGDLEVSGSARTSSVSVAGSGKLRARGLRSETASVSVAGSGDTSLTVNGSADISIVGSGNVDIDGTSRCSVSKMGSGKATCSA
ncbi:DUF4097 family beta strand repeat protein [Altererythrobacter salegens]|uniref:DUF4097 family beta strand repeat protein n=1 Tax=Croceibacterium salegens TaxID=1737568 RepID=A0A6I4SWU5_9SPHN|nr:head GIN domain-containing protein [Croceibacterium salegens]MXO60515.1 DUF4097 family beta strand repeat protein [Croceibacterium salegens]